LYFEKLLSTSADTMSAYLKQEISSGDNSARSSSSFLISPLIIPEIFFICDNPGFFDNTSDSLT